MTYSNSGICSVLFRCEGSIFPSVFLKALFFGAVGGFALYLYKDAGKDGWYGQHIGANTDLHTYMGMMVALMLSFRTNNCFGRYNDGVACSGKMRTQARIIVSQASAFLTGSDEATTKHVDEIRRFVILHCLFFKRHMHAQDDKPLDKLGFAGTLSHDELTALQGCNNGAERAVLSIFWARKEMAAAMAAGHMSDKVLSLIDNQLSGMLDNFQAGCRLAFVPMPFPYAQARQPYPVSHNRCFA